MEMTDASGNTVTTHPTGSSSPDDSAKTDKKMKFVIPKIFKKRSGASSEDDEPTSDFDSASSEKKPESRGKAFLEGSPIIRKSFSERQTSPEIQGLNLSSMVPPTEIKDFRVYVATWNVGGKAPTKDMDLEEFLLMEGTADIYVCGFQEIVPLNAGNILVIEDNEPAAKWLSLMSQALNRPLHDSLTSRLPNSNPKDFKSLASLPFFQKPSLKVMTRNFRVDNSLLKTCNCPVEAPARLRKLTDLSGPRLDQDLLSVLPSITSELLSTSQISYYLIASKQMVGLFLAVWARKELVPYIAHLRVSTVGTGIMGRLGNKGCISISMSLHQTSFCFVCSHLASGEKEGDELRRNADVAEILKSIQFPKICRSVHQRAPEKIINHDRVFWFGDLNYRIALPYEDARVLLEQNDWNSLLRKDQLNIEREAGRVFNGFQEGRIFFAPTYKYSPNSDSYLGETTKSKKKRRTPAWCDRIVWHGEGIDQFLYIRAESRLSDHRPVCAIFSVAVEVRSKMESKFRKGYSCTGTRVGYENCIPQRHSFCQ